MPSRKQISLLGKWVEFRKKQIECSNDDESIKSSKLTTLYFIALLELSRQDSIICLERGMVLTSIWSNYFFLQQRILSGMQKEFELSTHNYKNMISKIESAKDDIVKSKDNKLAIVFK